MPVRFVDVASRQAFRAAVERLEEVSAVEVMVAVRRRSASWAHAHVLTGALVAVAALAFMLYSAHPFSTPALLIDPVLAGLAGGLLSTVTLPVERWLTPRSARRRAVAIAARATFLDRGLHRTRGATGVLVYVSQVERALEVVADDGVLAAVPAAEWTKAVASLEAAVAGGGVALGRALEALAPLVAVALPRADDDIDEIRDHLDAGEGTR